LRSPCISSDCDAFPRHAANGSPRARPAKKRDIEKLRSSCGAIRTVAHPWFTASRNPPPIVVSTVWTLGVAWISAATARIASSIAAMLVPSGATTDTWNSASSTSLGMYS
jgi:hypothetical protein